MKVRRCRRYGHGRRARQRGAAGIEFALSFPLLFGLFYAIVGYGLTMLLVQTMNWAAEEGARAAVGIDWRVPCPPPTDTACIQGAVTTTVQSTVATALAWLPDGIEADVTGMDGSSVAVVVASGPSGEFLLTVTVGHYDYQNSGFIPVITLPALGPIPHVPAALDVEATVTL